MGGLWAGTINTVVGSGTLVTFPILIALGITPVMAVVSNAMGLIAGGVSGAWGYRSELRGMRHNLVRLLPASLLGGITGAYLLLHLPEQVFLVVAPVLIVVALMLVIFQPRLQAAIKARRQNTPNARSHELVMVFLVFLTGVYGGYFVAAQGVLLVAILGIFMSGTLQNANAVKNVLALGVNCVAAVSYLLFAPDKIIWAVVGLIAISSLAGGFLGAKIGRRLPPLVLRGVIVTLGLVALYFMVMKLVNA
ncbi:sulfite exporter TauE/SafE family protein [Arthrobacter glacialis]|uniref:Probable membrane transporter protein n=2 Tax=Arthrobacter glacialis TaxID=1664 RepID=A0A2S3ZWA1_ARTGL|nr:sulfite exporter TauE/SafE family protein [Arthrobacter glacialis]POH58663.1 sulfite exporter TauE/SafE family protein [Arthrobacter glacialis]POH73498.1 sulfite exporter TauE/SafE family protein [Arthrobacter glacialis]